MSSRQRVRQSSMRRSLIVALAGVCAALAPEGLAAPQKNSQPAKEQVATVTLAGGRRLEYVRGFSSEREVKVKRSLWNKVVDLVAGPPEYRRMVRPYSIAVTSRGRIVVTDPGIPAVHLFDFEKQKYKQLEGGKGEAFESPQGVAVDADDTIYVTDSARGRIFVFDGEGRFQRFIGSLKGGEGFFKRPTGIAVNSAARQLYVTDTLRHRVYRLGLDGSVLGYFGERGLEPGQFNFPTEIALRGSELLVVDAMNFRVQTFTPDGRFLRSFGALGDRTGYFFRPKGAALDSEGNIYVVDGLLETVQVFSPAGELLYFFGRSGVRAGEFQLPAGICIDARDRIYVADSLNQRVQVFQYHRAPAAAGGAQ